MVRLTLNIPEEVEAALREEWGDLDKAAMESLLIESYRTGKISIGYLAKVLEVSRWEAERWLADRGVGSNYGPDDLAADRATIDRVFGAKR